MSATAPARIQPEECKVYVPTPAQSKAATQRSGASDSPMPSAAPSRFWSAPLSEWVIPPMPCRRARSYSCPNLVFVSKRQEILTTDLAQKRRLLEARRRDLARLNEEKQIADTKIESKSIQLTRVLMHPSTLQNGWQEQIFGSIMKGLNKIVKTRGEILARIENLELAIHNSAAESMEINTAPSVPSPVPSVPSPVTSFRNTPFPRPWLSDGRPSKLQRWKEQESIPTTVNRINLFGQRFHQDLTTGEQVSWGYYSVRDQFLTDSYYRTPMAEINSCRASLVWVPSFIYGVYDAQARGKKQGKKQYALVGCQGFDELWFVPIKNVEEFRKVHQLESAKVKAKVRVLVQVPGKVPGKVLGKGKDETPPAAVKLRVAVQKAKQGKLQKRKLTSSKDEGRSRRKL